jgi:hypothetical protein
MFRFAKTGHDSRAIGNRFFYELANCPLTIGNSIFAILDKAIFIEHGFLLSLAQFLELTGRRISREGGKAEGFDGRCRLDPLVVRRFVPRKLRMLIRRPVVAGATSDYTVSTYPT